MLKKRIIPCFDIKNGRVVKGVNFVGLRDAGNPLEMAAFYASQGADELVFLDITATIENRKTLSELVQQIASTINIPFTVGGGIITVDDTEILIRAGADKVSINSAAVKTPQLITDIAQRFGNQAVVVAIDIKLIAGKYEVFINGGRVATGLDAVEWAKTAESLGAGEILLTSMNSDGTKDGFDIDGLNAIGSAVKIPVIASGGAGEMGHFRQVFTETEVGAALAASVFHFGDIKIPELKNYLRNEKIAIR